MRFVALPGRPSRRRAAFGRSRQPVFLAVATVAVLMAVTFRLAGMFDPQFGAAFLVLAAVVLVAVARPAIGLGLGIMLAVAGDGVALGWWPMVKNFSASESVLYAFDALTFTPLELVLFVLVLVWLVSRFFDKSRAPIEYGLYWRPLVLFTAMLVFGLVWGLTHDGDLRIAVFEAAPLFYIPVVYILATNLFTTMRHYRLLFLGVIAAVTFESVLALARLPILRQDLAEDASPVEHTAALHMNLVFLILVAAIWFGTRKLGKRPLLLVLLVPTLLLYLEAERRASVVGLIVGGMYLAFVLYSRDRQKFMRVIPIMLLLVAMYSAAFWNVESQAGFPAQAVKILVQPDASSEKDASSDLYREIENFDLNATVRSSPITGIGFGRPFLQPIPLPNISFFQFWEYIPHHSVLWMWTKVGAVGFVAFLYFVALGISTGIRAASRMRDPDDAALVATLGAFIPMTLVVAFVDITFDAQTTVLLGLALALVASAERLTGLSVPETAADHADQPVRAEDQPASNEAATSA